MNCRGPQWQSLQDSLCLHSHLGFLQTSKILKSLNSLANKQVIKDFASGEIKQASSFFDCGLTLDDSLIASSTKAAAIFSSSNPNICNEMYDYGKNLGLSFEVVHDILDFTQSSEQLGKPATSDLRKDNLTAPVIFALQEEPKLRERIDSEFIEEGSLEKAIELVHSCGGIKRAEDLAKEKGNLAIKNLQCLPQREFKTALENMVMYNLKRID